MPLTAVILAGGKSSRMGRDKAFLPFQGKPLIEHALQVVREAGADEVLISGRSEQDFSAHNCPVLLDRIPDCGPLGGIERGLEAAKHPMVLILAVDLPHMTGDCLRWALTQGSDETGSSGRQSAPFSGLQSKSRLTSAATEVKVGVVPIHNGHLEPLAALYPKAAHTIASSMLREGSFAACAFATRCIREGLARPLEVPVELEHCFTNWNEPMDCIP